MIDLTVRKRLVIVSGSFPEIACGVSRHVDIVARGTSQRGDYEVHVLTSSDPAVDTGLGRDYEVHARVKRWGILWAREISPCSASAQRDMPLY